MSTPETLRFRARGTALVPHFEREDAGIRCYVGRRRSEPEPGRLAFAPTNETETVPYRQEYVKACADGDLYAADEETAKACNHFARSHGLPEVHFDATFGGAIPRAVVTGTHGDADASRLIAQAESPIVIDLIDHDDPADDSAEKADT